MHAAWAIYDPPEDESYAVELDSVTDTTTEFDPTKLYELPPLEVTVTDADAGPATDRDPAIHSLVDGLAIKAGRFTRQAAGKVQEFIDSVPGAGTAIKLLDWGLWIAGGPAKMVLSAVVGKASEAAVGALTDRFESKGYSVEESQAGGTGGPVLLTLAVSGIGGALKLMGVFGGLIRGSGKAAAKGGAASKVTWVDENVGLKGLAKDYNDSAMGARSNPLTKSGQAPALERTMPDGTKRLVKFDGLDGEVMIDRKVSIVTTQKAKDQALRQSEVLQQNGLTGRWEVPNAAQQVRAVKMLNSLNVRNITVVVEKPW